MWLVSDGLVGATDKEKEAEEETGGMVCEPRGEEGVKPKARKLAEEPTQAEIDEHNIGHGVFRAWCPHCVKCKAQSFGHMKKKDEG